MRTRFFVYVKELFRARYVHGHERARNFSSPVILLNCIMVDYHYLFSTVFIFLFSVSISYYFYFEILVDLVSHLPFYLVFTLLYLLTFLLLILPGDLFSQKCRVKTKCFILFFPLDIYMKTGFNFF